MLHEAPAGGPPQQPDAGATVGELRTLKAEVERLRELLEQSEREWEKECADLRASLAAAEGREQALRVALDHFLGAYEDLIYITGKDTDLDEYDHPLYQERKDSRVDEAEAEARAALAKTGETQ